MYMIWLEVSAPVGWGRGRKEGPGLHVAGGFCSSGLGEGEEGGPGAACIFANFTAADCD